MNGEPTSSHDPYFARLTSMTDGTGTTQYSYYPVGVLGALQRSQESGPLPSSTIATTYDALGRSASRAVVGMGSENFGYDAIGRLTSHASDLGSFTLGYLGQTNQIASRQLASSTIATTWGYLPNSGDRRLASIGNVGFSAGQFSNYQLTTTPENFISAVVETSDSPTVYPTTGTQTASYNNLNQLTNLSGQALIYDADGNLTSDGLRTYTWDAENRLIGIGYPAQPGKHTAFAYDGLGRRITIASTPAGGGAASTTSYVWCGAQLCQARNAANATSREYLGEGEVVPGSPAQPYYYGIDQIGSVRRAFAGTASAPAYSYDPYGKALQGTAPVTDLGYAGMFYNADSGLYLTQFRAYDPVAGRWLSRDRMEGSGDSARNLYAYVGGNPISGIDPLGLCGFNPLNDPGLLLLMAGTEILGGGPEDPIADLLVAEEFDLAASAAEAVAEEGTVQAVEEGAVEAAEAIATPYGAASQELSSGAMAARGAVENGATLHRGGKLGISAGPEAQFWSLGSPLNAGYAERYGIPAENMGFDFVESGTLNAGTKFITRSAPGIGSNAGGAIEVVTPSGGVTLNQFTMP